MVLKILQKYSVKVELPTKKKKKTLFDLAKKHICKTRGKKEDLALNTDKILYGKK
ncbi:MAG: hypothetical protein Q8P68_01890 [Candidatus Peregrinibacteria bacterium]|nr:hypothetical protein [Candidatus Peregrinibacteria bacterium]MDZ4244511.1 hypothetical protein [Candidatus Gracilibacteria bacterium]